MKGKLRRRAVAIVIVLMLAVAALAGCSTGGGGTGAGNIGGGDEAAADGLAGEPTREASDGSGIAVTDMVGREVRLDAPATRVVALMPSDVETLYAIGAGDMLVGRGEYCDYPPEALGVQSVQSGNEANFEQIIALEPQLLLVSKLAHDEALLDQFESAGVKVFVTDPQDIEGVYTSIELMGVLMGKENEAEAVVDGMKDTLSELRTKAAAAGGGQKTIYFEVSPLEYGLWTAANGTFMNEVAELLGMRNIFDDVSDWVEVSEEQVLERNPDYILTVGMYYGDGPTPIESILARPGWENITAVKNKAILNLTADELSRPGPRLALGAQLLYEFVYEGGSATPSEG